MKKLLSFAVLAGLLVCTACSLHPHEQYTLRYKTTPTIVDPDPDANKTAKVSAFVLDVPEGASGKTLSDLPERAQAAAIKAIGASPRTSTKDLLAAIGSPIGKKQKKTGDEDQSVFKKRIVLALVSLTTTAPADRFTFAKLSLVFPELPETQAKFVSWDKFATQYQTVDLGSLSYTQNRELDLKLTAQAPHGAGGEVDSKTANALQEQAKLSQRYTTITGSLTPNEADLIQQGAPGIDLAGNISVDMTIKVPANKDAYTITDFGELFAEGGKPTDPVTPTDPAKLSVSSHSITAPKNQCRDIMADLTLNYVLRHVVEGAGTITESDDVVEFRIGTLSPVSVTLVPADELKVPTWNLRLNDRILSLERVPGAEGNLKTQPITFDSYDNGKQFLLWLIKTKPHAIGGRRLMFPPDRPFNPDDSGQLLISRVDADCTNKPEAKNPTGAATQ
jgi:hypothetical protein